MQDRGRMLELAVLAHRRRLAVAFRPRTRNPERCDGALAQQLAELLADVDQGAEVLDVSPGAPADRPAAPSRCGSPRRWSQSFAPCPSSWPRVDSKPLIPAKAGNRRM